MTLKDTLKQDEGLRLRAYPDPVSHGEPWTIGYGHTGPDVHGGMEITGEQAESLLDADITKATAALETALPWACQLDEARRGALINMTFNMGINHLLGFHHFLTALQCGDYSTAAEEMLDSLWAKQVGSRAIRLSRVIAHGVI
jgi:lysozyme